MRKPKSTMRSIRPLADFLHTESAGGALLVLAAMVGLGWANSPWSDSFFSLWNTEVSVAVGQHGVSMDLRHWLNDGLMTLFFLLVGLEIKRELVEGELADKRHAALPAIAAAGGMIVPALIFTALAAGTAEQSGWGIPVATDIALALGVLSLFGNRVPSSAKVFLLALAIVDDIGAIVVIAIFYSKGFSLLPFVIGVLAIASAPLARRLGAEATWVFVIIGTVAWLFIHESGVHATLVGVAMGLMAPVVPRLPEDLVDEDTLTDLSSVDAALETVRMARSTVSSVEWIEHKLHPWSSFAIVPLFALANMGVIIDSETISAASSSAASFGVFFGLVIGKPLGIALATFIGIKVFRLALPAGVSALGILGIGSLAGIGFTVSLFVTELAFDDEHAISAAKLAVVIASVVAASIGAVIFRFLPNDPEPAGDTLPA